MHSTIQQAREVLANGRRILVFSGAGLSKASGIPTYRDEGGLWTVKGNTRFAHRSGLQNDPKGFEAFWEQRHKELAGAEPNAAHRALAQLQQLRPETLLVTQNIDGLLQRAGCADVVELHGSAWRKRCKGCSKKGDGLLGRCVRCGGKLRPDVVLFGENLDGVEVQRVLEAATTVDVVLVVGSTLEVYPAAQIPERALNYGAKLILVDPNPPAAWVHAATVCLRQGAEEALPAMLPE